MDLRELQERYRDLPTDRLMILAREESAGLTPQALDLLREELRRRGMEEIRPGETDAAMGEVPHESP